MARLRAEEVDLARRSRVPASLETFDSIAQGRLLWNAMLLGEMFQRVKAPMKQRSNECRYKLIKRCKQKRRIEERE